MIRRKPVAAFSVFACLILLAGPLLAGVNRWTPIGPDGGAVTALATAPAVSGLVYAATRTGGVFRSRDGGQTWEPARSGLPSGEPTLLLATGGREGRTLYAATKSSFYTSTNGGGLWVRRTLPVEDFLVEGFLVALAASPAAPQTVYLSYARGGLDGGLLRSTDGGETWRALELPFLHSYALPGAFDIALAPSAPKTLYLSTLGEEGRVLRSTDGGDHWTVAGTLESEAVYDFSVRLAVDPRDPRRVYAAYGETVAASTDAGATWSRLAVVDPAEYQGPQSAVDLEIDPADPAILFSRPTSMSPITPAGMEAAS
jgi:photosystem II stability/assembly factor-like uncharacterized protein